MNKKLGNEMLNKCSNSTKTSIDMLLKLIECTAENIDISKGFYSVLKFELMNNSIQMTNEETQALLDSVKEKLDTSNEKLMDGFKEVEQAEILNEYFKTVTPYLITEGTKEKEKVIFDDHLFQRFLIDTFNIVSIENKVSFFNGKKYCQDEAELNRLISNVLTLSRAKSSIQFKREIIDAIRFSARKVEKNSNFIISFENGILPLEPNKEIELLRHSKDYVITNKIPHKFITKPSALALERVNNLLNDWSNYDESVKQNIIETCAYCMFPDNRFKKVIFIYGPANGGKSLFLKLLKNMLGVENTSSVKLHNLANRFELFHCEGKLANISDEISSKELSPDESNTIKDLSSEAVPKVEHKGKDSSYSSKFSTKLIFGCNDIPATKDMALFSRFLIIPFLNNFKTGGSYEAINNLISSEENLEALLYLVVSKAKEMLNKISCGAQPFTESKIIKDYTKKYLYEIDPIKSWIDTFDREDLIEKCYC